MQTVRQYQIRHKTLDQRCRDKWNWIERMSWSNLCEGGDLNHYVEWYGHYPNRFMPTRFTGCGRTASGTKIATSGSAMPWAGHRTSRKRSVNDYGSSRNIRVSAMRWTANSSGEAAIWTGSCNGLTCRKYNESGVDHLRDDEFGRYVGSFSFTLFCAASYAGQPDRQHLMPVVTSKCCRLLLGGCLICSANSKFGCRIYQFTLHQCMR
jgi:hypothetical protein